MKAFIFGAALAVAGLGASAQTILLDTFNEENQDALFDCCNAWQAAGRVSDIGLHEAATPFTPAANARITEIDIPLGFVSGGGDAVEVQIARDKAGLPAKQKKNFLVRGLPGAGQCCSFMTLTAAGIKVLAGVQYWVVVKGVNTQHASWNMNSMGSTGSVAVIDTNHGTWRLTQDTLPAVRVIAAQ